MYFLTLSWSLLARGEIETMHWSSEIALDFVEGRLAGDQQVFWSKHLETCADCAEDLGRWRQLGVDLKRSHLQSASEEVLKTVADVFPNRREEHASSRRSAIATLIFDS